MRPTTRLVSALALTLMAATGIAQEYNPARREPASRPPISDQRGTDQRIIVQLRAASTARVQIQAEANAANALAQRTGIVLRQSRDLGTGMHVMSVEPAVVGETVEQTLARLRADPDVEFAELDERRYIHAVPNDPLFANQWFQKKTEASAINAGDAWDTAPQGGSPNLVIAFIDTGVRFDHPDLGRASQGGRLLDGFDFVSDTVASNDGDGWDADATDPGDWVDSTDRQNARFASCTLSGSSWHGTRVAGVIGARTNNTQGVAGITWNPRLLPLRALGKCGGLDSDIVAAMRWAGGIAVSGAPTNATPARVINLSLGSTGSCPASYQNTVSELRARGVLVVVSAGNETGHAVSSPANCPGVLAVAAVRHVGSKVGFSNIGPQIGISAPGGNCVNIGQGEPCLFSIDTTTDSGTTTPLGPAFTDQFNFNVGTSFSAPIAAATAGLVRSVNSTLTPAQVIARIQQSANPFPVVGGGVAACQVPTTTTGDQLECNCTTSTCGAGLLNANGAVALALKPFVIVSANPVAVNSGQAVTLDSTGTFVADTRTISTYAWTVVAGSSSTPTLTNANQASASFTAPATVGTITLRLTVTDNQGAQDSADVPVTVTAPAPPPPPPQNQTGGGGGGGGALEWLTLLALLTAFSIQRSRMRSAMSSHSFCARR